MVISRKKQLNYVLNLNYPMIGNKVQIDLDDTDSITFSRFVSKKAVVMCANRLEYILANNPDNFDLDTELSNLHETLRFAEVNLKVAGGIEEWNGNTAWVCANSFGMELMFASKPHKVDDSWRDNNGCCNCLELPKGTIKKLIGKELSFFDEPVKLKEE